MVGTRLKIEGKTIETILIQLVSDLVKGRLSHEKASPDTVGKILLTKILQAK